MHPDMERDIWYPAWMSVCTQPEPVIKYHRELLEKKENLELFERAFAVLVTKAKEGRRFTINESCQVNLHIWCTGFSDIVTRIEIQEIFFERKGFNGMAKSMDFIVLKDDLERPMIGAGPERIISFSQRTIEFDMRKLSETALSVVEANPPEERRWISERGYAVNAPKALNALIEEVEDWKVVPEVDSK